MKAKQTRWLAVFALSAYSVILIKLVVFKAIPTLRMGHLRLKFAGPHTGPANLIPFKTIVPQVMGQGNHLIGMANLIGNIIPFMPIGLLVPLVFISTSWQRVLVLGVVMGLIFEVTEVVFRVGIFDVDDVILNAFGVIVGYGVFAMLKRGTQSRPG